MDRVRPLLPGSQNRKPNANMRTLMDTLGESTIIPEVDKYYVFVYKAATPGIMYDQNPLVAVTAIFKWGFVGFNYHWGEARQYTWGEIKTNLYEVTDEELNSAKALPIAKIRRS